MKIYKILIFIFLVSISFNSYAETKLRMANWLPPSHPWVKNIMIPWINNVKEATEGRVIIEILNAPLGPPHAHFDFALKGIADITYGVHNYTAGRFISTQLAELPFLSNSSEILSVAWQRIYQKELYSLDEHKGTHLLGVFNHGPGQLWLNNMYENLDEIKGLKVRIGGGISQSSAKALKLIPLQAPVTKAYELLSGGVADGIQLPTESISFFKLDRIIKQGFIVDGGLYNVSMFVVINKRKWDSLDKIDQEAISSVSGEVLASLAGKAWDEADEKSKSLAIQNGVKFVELSPKDKNNIKNILSPVIKQTLADIKKKKNIDANKIYSLLKKEINSLEKK